jgi:jumonji domain-containing protein 7
MEAEVDRLTRDLIVAYTQLNSSAIDEFDEAPSPLEFARFVGKNRPFVVRDAVSHWAAVQSWDKEYMQNVMGEQQVNVAITPSGAC